MLLGGVIASNALPQTVSYLKPEWSMIIRKLALTMILIRAGLKVDIHERSTRNYALISLIFIPQIIEVNLVAVMAYGIWNLPRVLGYALGFMLAGVSPAAIIPCCIKLRNEGYGTDKGIPNLLIIASSLDSISTVIGFGIFLDIYTQSDERDVVLTIISESEVGNTILIVAIEILGGILLGITLGAVYSLIKTLNYKLKAWILFIMSATSVTTLLFIGFGNLGFISTIISCSIARTKWGHFNSEKTEDYLAGYWVYLQIALLGLIGAIIYFPEYDGNIVGYSVLMVFVISIVRIPVTALSILKTRTNSKEKLFVGVSWICKATVQAALGPLLLSTAIRNDYDDTDFYYGEIFLTVAVVCILLTAPIGAFLMGFLGPRLLNKSPKPLLELQENLLKNNPFPQVKESSYMSLEDLELANEQLYHDMEQELSALVAPPVNHSHDFSPLKPVIQRAASISETLALARCRLESKKEGYKSD